MNRPQDMRRLMDLAAGSAKEIKTINESETPFKSFRSWSLTESDDVDPKQEDFLEPEAEVLDEMSLLNRNDTNAVEDIMDESNLSNDQRKKIWDAINRKAREAITLSTPFKALDLARRLCSDAAREGVSEDEHLGNEEDTLDRMYNHHMAGHDDYFGQYDMWKGVNEEDGDGGPEVDEITGPSYWASYFINGDDSGLEPDEKAAADAWLERIKPWYVVGIATDPETGESQEGRYTNHYAMHSGTNFTGGNVVDYIVHKRREEKPVDESADDREDCPVYNAVKRRLMLMRIQSPALDARLDGFSDEEVNNEIKRVADYVGQVDEIGSSDVSLWTQQVIDALTAMADHRQAANEADNQLELPPLAEDGEEDMHSEFPEIGMLNNGDRYAFVDGYDKPEVRGSYERVKAAVLAARARRRD